jgi:uncharacterized metal-binding protein
LFVILNLGIILKPIDLSDKVSTKATIFACSGSANVGQLSNSCALSLEKEGRVLFACTASLGCHEEKMLKIARDSPRVIALDGCSMACCSRTLEHAGIAVDAKISMTDLGFEKVHGELFAEGDIVKALGAVRQVL